MVSNNTKIAGGMFGIFAGIIAVVFIFGGGTNFVTGNVSQLSLAENFRDLNCDAWNELAVTRNGQVSTVGSGREGFNPLFESGFQTASLLSVTDGSAEVDAMHVRLVLNCDGNFLKHPTAVSGRMSFQLCGDPSADRTTCFAGDDRTFQQLQGVAVSTATFFDVPIQSQTIPDDEPKVIWEGDISAFELERLFQEQDGNIHFKSIMLPVLTWQINHRDLGIITATYNGINENDPIIAQYGLLRVIDEVEANLDADGDGIIDSLDACINQAETVNGFEDNDGCPDVVPPADTDGDGVPDDVDECVSVIGTIENNGCPEATPVPEPETDTDGDGVVDSIDQCINEVGTVGNMGCPEPAIMEEEEPPEDIGEFIPPPLPDPIFEPLPPPIPTPDVPITTTSPLPATEEEERQFLILMLIVVGIIGVIIAGLVQRARRK